MMLGCSTLFQMGISLIRRHSILILWFCFISSIFWSSYSRYKMEPKYFYLRQIIGSGLCMSRGMASIINVSCFMVTLPVCRFLTAAVQVFGSKLPAKFIAGWVNFNKQFHTICAFTIVVAAVFHTIAHFVNAWNFSRYYNPELQEINLAKAKGEDPLLMVIGTVPGVTGILMMLILCVLYSSSTKYLRHSSYDLFWFSHHLFLVFLLLLLCHPMSGMLKEQSNVSFHFPGCQRGNSSLEYTTYHVPRRNCSGQPYFVPQTTHTWKWVTMSFSVYLVDVAYRLFRRTQTVHILSVESFNCQLMALKLLKQGFVARPGQFVYLQCPSISAMEWHPFSISKCPTKDDPCFTIHLRTKGDWSYCLQSRLSLEFLSNGNSAFIQWNNKALSNPTSHPSRTQVGIDGPFGSNMEKVTSYSVSICIAGGIGFTPFASVLNVLRADPKAIAKPKRLHLLWICREVEMISCFSSLLADTFHVMWNANKPDMFDFRLYITKYHVPRRLRVALKDDFSFIQTRLTFGRPEWNSLFQQWGETYHRSNTGVFCCGPKSLNNRICQIMRSRSTQKWCNFSYYQESFS